MSTIQPDNKSISSLHEGLLGMASWLLYEVISSDKHYDNLLFNFLHLLFYQLHIFLCFSITSCVHPGSLVLSLISSFIFPLHCACGYRAFIFHCCITFHCMTLLHFICQFSNRCIFLKVVFCLLFQKSYCKHFCSYFFVHCARLLKVTLYAGEIAFCKPCLFHLQNIEKLNFKPSDTNLHFPQQLAGVPCILPSLALANSLSQVRGHSYMLIVTFHEVSLIIAQTNFLCKWSHHKFFFLFWYWGIFGEFCAVKLGDILGINIFFLPW